MESQLCSICDGVIPTHRVGCPQHLRSDESSSDTPTFTADPSTLPWADTHRSSFFYDEEKEERARPLRSPVHEIGSPPPDLKVDGRQALLNRRPRRPSALKHGSTHR